MFNDLYQEEKYNKLMDKHHDLLLRYHDIVDMNSRITEEFVELNSLYIHALESLLKTKEELQYYKDKYGEKKE